MSQYANLPAFLVIEHIPAGPSQLAGPYQRLSSVRRVMEASPTGAVCVMAVLPRGDCEYFDLAHVKRAATTPHAHATAALSAMREAKRRDEALLKGGKK